jgi:micrococcal nuclease
MNKPLYLFLLSLLLFLLSCAPQGVRVVRVIDGDTIVIEGGERVRYIGINAPELNQPWGKEAWQLNKKLVGGKRVRLERDVSHRDKYGRLLRYVFVDNLFVNGELVRRGLAWAKAYPPDLKYQQLLQQLEREAKEGGRGIWKRSKSGFYSPKLRKALSYSLSQSLPQISIALAGGGGTGIGGLNLICRNNRR